MGIRCGACAYTAAMRTVALVTAVAAGGLVEEQGGLGQLQFEQAGLAVRAGQQVDACVGQGRLQLTQTRGRGQDALGGFPVDGGVVSPQRRRGKARPRRAWPATFLYGQERLLISV